MSEKAAIQKDVVGTQQDQQDDQQQQHDQDQQRPVLPRDEMMAELAKKRSEQFHAEAGTEDRGDDSASEDDEVEEQGREEGQQRQADEDEGDPSQQQSQSKKDDTADDDERVLLKVNGREIWKSRKEVEDAGGVAAIQKRLAGELKLEEAANQRKELERRQAELDQRERELSQREAAAKAQPTQQQAQKQTPDDLKKKAEQMAEDLVLGDVAKVSQTLGEILAATQQMTPSQQQAQPTVDAVALANQVADQAQRTLDLRRAQSDFQRDFKDIYENPAAKQYANQQTIVLQRENPNWSFNQILTEAGKRTRSVMKTTGDPLADKQQRKQQSTDRLAQAQSRSASPQHQQERPKTKREIFEEMQKMRSGG